MSNFKITENNGFVNVLSEFLSNKTNTTTNKTTNCTPPVFDEANSAVKRSDEQMKADYLRRQIESCWTAKNASSADVIETAAVTQTKDNVRSSNPDGIVNAVENATGLARVFGSVLPNGYVAHDGAHVIAPVGSKIKTLPALEGKIIDLHNQGDGTYALDVLVNKPGQKPFVVIYKDIAVDPKIISALKRGEHPTLKAGDTIGKTAAGGEGMGVHVTLLRGGQKEHDYYRLQTRTIHSIRHKLDDLDTKLDAAEEKGNTLLVKQYEQQKGEYNKQYSTALYKMQVGLFIDPLDAEESPIACPDIKADPMNVIPYKKAKAAQ